MNFDKIISDVMNLQCRRKDDSFASAAERMLYKEGHRDARHDACDIIAAAKAPAAQADYRTVIANLASVVRAQNGNRHADINELLEQAEKYIASSASAPEAMTSEQQPASQQDEDAKDAARLDFMIEHEAWISWNRDHESCRVFIDDLDSRRPMMGWVPEASAYTAREAINAAMSAHQAKKSEGA